MPLSVVPEVFVGKTILTNWNNAFDENQMIKYLLLYL